MKSIAVALCIFSSWLALTSDAAGGFAGVSMAYSDLVKDMESNSRARDQAHAQSTSSASSIKYVSADEAQAPKPQVLGEEEEEEEEEEEGQGQENVEASSGPPPGGEPGGSPEGLGDDGDGHEAAGSRWDGAVLVPLDAAEGAEEAGGPPDHDHGHSHGGVPCAGHDHPHGGEPGGSPEGLDDDGDGYEAAGSRWDGAVLVPLAAEEEGGDGQPPATEEAGACSCCLPSDEGGHQAGAGAGEQEEEEGEEEEGEEGEDDVAAAAAYGGPYAEELRGLVAQGWHLEYALQALYDTKGDAAAAAAALQAQERAAFQARFDDQVATLVKDGWEEDKARGQVAEVHFNQTVDEMVSNGWDEQEARQALLEEFKNVEEEKQAAQQAAQGDGAEPAAAAAPGAGEEAVAEGTATATAGAAAAVAQTPAPAAEGAVAAAAAAPLGNKSKPPPPAAPKEAKPEDVIFEVTVDNLQKVVLDSPVPVLLDVYADWCAPCRQLTPALEEAAVKSGGLFRLAKLNSDANRGLSDTLKVTGLPTVFGFNKGRLVDSFTGGLSGEEMQAFLMGVVMGRPSKRQRAKGEHSPEDLEKLQLKLALSAGMASMGSIKRERLAMLLDECLEALVEECGGDMGQAQASVDVMRKACKNAFEHPEEAKYRSLPAGNPTILAKVRGYEAASRALHLVGFRLGADESELRLVHRNPAPLLIAEQRFSKWIALARKSTEKKLEIPDDIHDRIQYSSSDDEEEQPVAPKELADGKARITVHLPDGSVLHKIFPSGSTKLGDVFRFIKKTSPQANVPGAKILPQFPAAAFDANDPPLDYSLDKLKFSPGASLLVYAGEDGEEVNFTNVKRSPSKGAFPKKRQQTEEVSSDSDNDSKDMAGQKSASSKDEEEAPEKQQAKPKKSSFAERAAARKQQKKGASLFGPDDGLIEKRDDKKQEYYGGSGTVFYYPSDDEDDDDAAGSSSGVSDSDDDISSSSSSDKDSESSSSESSSSDEESVDDGKGSSYSSSSEEEDD